MCKSAKKYTIQQFRNDFPNDDVCLEKIFQLRYSDVTNCPFCEEDFSYRRIPTRQCYQCTKCYGQIYPCAGTIFEKSRTPLLTWFYVMYLFTTIKGGVSAYEIQDQIGVTYKTAWRMLKQIRILMSKDSEIFFSGSVELDETFVGGKNKNRHRDKKVAKSQGRSFKDKTPVFGIYHRETGKVATYVITNTSRAEIQPIIYNHIELGSQVNTDEWHAYKGLNRDYDHNFVNHGIGNYANGDTTTNRMENYWSNLKRMLGGTYIRVSPKYLQLYANERAFRFNNRNSEEPVFTCLLNSLAS